MKTKSKNPITTYWTLKIFDKENQKYINGDIRSGLRKFIVADLKRHRANFGKGKYSYIVTKITEEIEGIE